MPCRGVSFKAMSTHIQWSGAGAAILFLPGWNTSAAAVKSWLPPAFLEKYRCGVLEWPGQGEAPEAPLPERLDTFLDEMAETLPVDLVAVVGFCMGGIAAWAFARRHPDLVGCSVLVETPQQFPLVLAPLLIPGCGCPLLRVAQQTWWGRAMVRLAILQRRTPYSQEFIDSLFAYEARVALHYIHLFHRYSSDLAGSQRPWVSRKPCWRLLGGRAVRVLAPTLGSRHRVEATTHHLEGAGHFPAVEAPDAFLSDSRTCWCRANRPRGRWSRPSSASFGLR